MKLKVAIAVTEKVAYDVKDIAVCTLEVEHADTNPRALRSALEALTEDVSERVTAQLRAIEKANAAIERAAEDVPAEAPF